MNTFLEIVARDLYNKIGEDLKNTVVIFPNKRASLFFNEYLAQTAGKTIWAPKYVSISELFEEFSELKIADKLTLICELYHVFRDETETEESLDNFFFWGEVLIHDFDEIDKNLVNADKLFDNLNNLKKLDDLNFLTEEQVEHIKEFFQNFSIEKNSELKKRFNTLWDKLGPIYRQFNRILRTKKTAYEGMVIRDVIENPDFANLLNDKYYVFIGFNLLNKSEKNLFHSLKQKNKALFYWDYDVYYTKETSIFNQTLTNEAGTFIRQNLHDFPNELSEVYFNNYTLPKQINFVSAQTDNIQASYVPEWIKQNISINKVNEKENVIVLCDENLLLPVIHTIPPEIKHLNITMGFPLAQTPVFSLLNALLSLYQNYDSKSGKYLLEDVLNVLKQPYINSLSENCNELIQTLTDKKIFYPKSSDLLRDTFTILLFTPQTTAENIYKNLAIILREIAIWMNQNKNSEMLEQLYNESLFKSYTILTRIIDLIQKKYLNVTLSTLRYIVNQLLLNTTVPFHGEPANGLQVMGVLETRNLDFKNVLMLSVNEGVIPQKKESSSLIPYNLRKGFGLSTIEHSNSIYGYYFYRLMQRSETITLVYNRSVDLRNKGEMSRFMLQLLIESPHNIKKINLHSGLIIAPPETISVAKSKEILSRMLQKYQANPVSPQKEKLYTKRSYLSPSSLNTYLDCKLKFYFQQILGLRVLEDVSTNIEYSDFGSIFHLSAEYIYDELSKNKSIITQEALNKLLANEWLIENAISKAFNRVYFKVNDDDKPLYNGLQLINKQVIKTFIKQLLRIDIEKAPFKLIAQEQEVTEPIRIQMANQQVGILIGGKIDRIDTIGDVLRIVDYKTGGKYEDIDTIESLFSSSIKRPKYVFQIFVYSAIISHLIKKNLFVEELNKKISPCLVYITKTNNPKDYSSNVYVKMNNQNILVDNFAENEEVTFREKLIGLIEELFDESVPFNQTEDLSVCESCDFKNICNR